MKELDSLKDIIATNFSPRHRGAYGEFTQKLTTLMTALGQCDTCQGRGYTHLPSPIYCNCGRAKQLKQFYDLARTTYYPREHDLPPTGDRVGLSSPEGQDSRNDQENQETELEPT